MGKSIPKYKKIKKDLQLPINPSKRLYDANENKLLTFSFAPLDYNEYFNLDCTCANWSYDLVKTLQELSSISGKRFVTDSELRSGKYRIHAHNVEPPTPYPKGIETKEVIQIRFGTYKGGIHGYLYENIFFIVWLDPLHNMYPNDRYGGLKNIKPPTTCCGWHNDELQKLAEENDMYREMLEQTE